MHKYTGFNLIFDRNGANILPFFTPFTSSWTVVLVGIHYTFLDGSRIEYSYGMVPSIKKGSTEQAQIVELFERKKWRLLPRKDKELDALMSCQGFTRTQISRQFLIW
jgi:hypothetical protein